MKNIHAFMHGLRKEEIDLREAKFAIEELRNENKKSKQELVSLIRSNDALMDLFFRPLEDSVKKIERKILREGAQLSGEDLKANVIARIILERICSELSSSGEKKEE